MRSLELFTGAGGLALGTHAVGFEHVGLVEWNADACMTLLSNVREATLTGIERWRVHKADIRTFDFAAYKKDGVDLIAGGVPCQPFSIGGKGQGRADERDMFPEFVRAVRTLKPRAFIIENVRGLLRRQFAEYFNYIELQLQHPDVAIKKDEGWEKHRERLEKQHTKGAKPAYNVVWRLLNAADYGVPQRRERVFIVGFRSDSGIEFAFPAPSHSKAALEHAQVSGDYWKRHGMKAREMGWSPSAKRDGLLPWVTIRDAIRDLPTPRANDPSAAPDHRLNPGARAYPGHTGSDIDLPSKTLKAGVHGVPGGENMIAFPDGKVRYLTVREAARLQSFPDTWYFAGAWSEAMRQLGNAVPMKLAEVVARAVAGRLTEAGST